MAMPDWIVWIRVFMAFLGFCLSVAQMLAAHYDLRVASMLVKRNGRYMAARGSYLAESTRGLVLWIFFVTAVAAAIEAPDFTFAQALRQLLFTLASLALSMGTVVSWYTRRAILRYLEH